MKTIESTDGKIKRVSDQEAALLTGKDWNYCPKSKWKALNVKEAKEQSPDQPNASKASKKSKKSKKSFKKSNE